jgi:hypothetical protein
MYLEALYETDTFNVGLQFGPQSYDTSDESGPDGDVWCVTASYTLVVGVLHLDFEQGANETDYYAFY